jgi:hypothetical protein
VYLQSGSIACSHHSSCVSAYSGLISSWIWLYLEDQRSSRDCASSRTTDTESSDFGSGFDLDLDSDFDAGFDAGIDSGSNLEFDSECDDVVVVVVVVIFVRGGEGSGTGRLSSNAPESETRDSRDGENTVGT